MSTSAIWRLLAAAFTVTVLIVGVIVTWAIMRPDAEIRRDTNLSSFTKEISRIEFQDFEASDVVVKTGSVSEIGIQRWFRWTGEDKPRYRETWNGTSLTVSHLCGDADSDDCSIKYVVTIPETSRALTVIADTSSGDVETAGVTGEIRVSTVSGDLRTGGAAGKLELRTVSGDLTAEETSSSSVSAHSVSGDLTLSFSSAPATIVAETTSGDLRVSVPRSTGGYRVSAETTSGERKVDVFGDGPAVIQAKTVSGDLYVNYR